MLQYRCQNLTWGTLKIRRVDINVHVHLTLTWVTHKSMFMCIKLFVCVKLFMCVNLFHRALHGSMAGICPEISGCMSCQQSLRCPFSLSGNRLLVCAAPRAHRPLGRHVLPRLLGAHAHGEILQQPRALQLPGESAATGMGMLPSEQTPSLPPAPQAITACAFCFPWSSAALLVCGSDKAARGSARGQPAPALLGAWASRAALPSARAASLPLCSWNTASRSICWQPV